MEERFTPVCNSNRQLHIKNSLSASGQCAICVASLMTDMPCSLCFVRLFLVLWFMFLSV